MKLYEIVLQPRSGFGTPLKGDTIFGHFCWQAAHDTDLLNGGLERWIARYDEQPFAVFSSAWPKLLHEGKWIYALKRPDLPLPRLFPDLSKNKRELMENRKKNAAKKWLLLPENMEFLPADSLYVTDTELMNIAFGELSPEARKQAREQGHPVLIRDFTQAHNSINRLTLTTGEGMFAPYTQSAAYFYPETELAIFVLVDEEATDINRIRTGLERIGRFGFGKDATTGRGRFDLAEDEEKGLLAWEGNACYTLAPVVPDQGTFSDAYFSPFTRYGRHGDTMATSPDPFKNPVIMADEGAVFVPNDKSTFSKPYLGRPARQVSKAMPETVVQGYAPYLPFSMEIVS